MKQTDKRLEGRFRARREELMDCDVKFIFSQDSPSQVIEAHRLVLALASDVFRAQFYGGIKQGSEIQIDWWSQQDFSIFIDSFYGDINLETFSISTLSELYSISDYYNVPQIKTATVNIIKNGDHFSDVEIAGAAAIAIDNQGLHPPLSQALFDKIFNNCGTNPNKIEEYFKQNRPQLAGPELEELIQAVIGEADLRVKRCRNCRKKYFNCRTQPFVNESNFIAGARVRATEESPGSSQDSLLVYRLGQLGQDLTFTSYDRLGFSLPALPLTYRGYKFSCNVPTI